MSSKKTRTPGHSHYADDTTDGGWYFNAWLHRRYLKIGTTSQVQDLVRFYEAMPPGMYRNNLAVKESLKSMDFWAYRGFAPSCLGVVDLTRYVDLVWVNGLWRRR
jgi:hypothetical protein